ncbi:MAG: hypothetical protein ACREJC_16060 [Tepidisphaeraceae bacterium]
MSNMTYREQSDARKCDERRDAPSAAPPVRAGVADAGGVATGTAAQPTPAPIEVVARTLNPVSKEDKS